MTEIVWTIAGSDSGGGAGIQADIAAMRAFSVHPCTIVTALTAQNSVTVNGVFATPTSMLLDQLETLLADLPPKAVKIGMLATTEQVSTIARFIAEHLTNIPIVVDPVAVATSGAALADGDVLQALLEELLPLANLVTPNISELEALTGMPVHDQQSLSHAAAFLRSKGIKAMLIKGGHAHWQEDLAIDYFFSDELSFNLIQPRRVNADNHGSGCTFASGVAALLGKGDPLEDAVVCANAYVAQGIRHGVKLGAGTGPLAQTFAPPAPAYFARLQSLGVRTRSSHTDKRLQLHQLECNFAPLKDKTPGLYPVVEHPDLLEEVLRCGVKIAQLRVKPECHSEEDIESAVCQAIALGEQYQSQVFINDHWQLALKYGAFGVHLGQNDLGAADMYALRKANIRLGISTHGYYELLRAIAWQPSYIALGHVFPTPTKQMKSQPQGLNKLRHYVALSKSFVTVAIGGIDIDNAEQVYGCGVDSVAVVRAVAQSTNIKATVEAFNRVV